VAALGASVLLASCSGSAPSPRQLAADRSFQAQVHAQAPDVSGYRTDVQLLRLGESVCDDLSAHATVAEVADRIPLGEGADPLPVTDLGAVISAAIGSLCPQYHALLASGGDGLPAAG
jgi:hypothetical protein